MRRPRHVAAGESRLQRGQAVLEILPAGDDDALRAPFHRQFLALTPQILPACEAARCFADEHLARLSCFFQARRDVHGVAGDGVAARSDGSRSDETCVDADADLQSGPDPPLELRV